MSLLDLETLLLPSHDTRARYTPVWSFCPDDVVRSQSTVRAPSLVTPFSVCLHNNLPLTSKTSISTSIGLPVRSWFTMKVVLVVAGFSVQLTLLNVGFKPFTTLKVSSAVDELLSMSHALNFSLWMPSVSCGML